jgi:hypothetical protein
VRIFDCGGLNRFPVPELKDALSAFRLQVELGKTSGNEMQSVAVADRESTWMLARIATRHLLGQRTVFEFLPPRSSRFKRLAGQVSARRAVWLAGAGAVVVLGVGLAFLFQANRLASLEKEWAAMAPQVRNAEALQESVRTFRPWFDDSVQSLKIATQLTSAFPEEGSVWVKTLEIKDSSKVSCSGNARTNQDWLRVLDSLRKTKGIEDLQVQQVRGNAPVQFGLSFRWSEGRANGI